VGGKRLRVCSQWFDKQRALFSRYLVEKRIVTSFSQKTDSERPVLHPSKSQNSRYGSIQIGDSQNAFIRFLLSRLGEESITERDWQETKAYFENGCAYCGESDADQMDHGIPINRSKLGEHRLGNIIPACKKCNTRKHQRDYREHLGDDFDRIARIEIYMKNKHYLPLGDNIQIKNVLEQAHKEVAALAERYIALLNNLMAGPPPPIESPEPPSAAGSDCRSYGAHARIEGVSVKSQNWIKRWNGTQARSSWQRYSGPYNLCG
jgi:hypothetical protein